MSTRNKEKPNNNQKQHQRGKGEGSIYQDKTGRWNARIQLGKKDDGKPFVKAFYGKTKAEAKKKLDEYVLIYNSNHNNNIVNDSVGVYFSVWLKLYKSRTVRPQTYDNLERLINNHIKPAFGMIQIKNLNTDILQDFFNKLADKKDKNGKKYAHATIVKIYNLINSCLSHALIKGDILKNPIAGVLIPTRNNYEEKREIIFLDEKEIDVFTDEAVRKFSNDKPVYRLGWGLVFIIYTGLRAGEAIGLKWKDINFEEKVISISRNIARIIDRDIDEDLPRKYKIIEGNTKTFNSTRQIYLNKKALDALMNLKTIVNPKSSENYIFATKSGLPTGRNNLLRLVINVSDAAGLAKKKYNIHSLRHTFASMLIRKGVDIKIVSELLGHTDVKLTYNTYVHLIKEQKTDALSKLDEL